MNKKRREIISLPAMKEEENEPRHMKEMIRKRECVCKQQNIFNSENNLK